MRRDTPLTPEEIELLSTPPLENTPILEMPDLDTVTRFSMMIARREPKPADLTPSESASWDRLEAQMKEGADRGWVVEIPFD